MDIIEEITTRISPGHHSLGVYLNINFTIRSCIVPMLVLVLQQILSQRHQVTTIVDACSSHQLSHAATLWRGWAPVPPKNYDCGLMLTILLTSGTRSEGQSKIAFVEHWQDQKLRLIWSGNFFASKSLFNADLNPTASLQATIFQTAHHGTQTTRH